MVSSIACQACEAEQQGISDMTTLAIPLSEEHVERLQRRAEQSGLSPEKYLRLLVEQLLDRPDEPFRKAATYVLDKNKELYRRLA
jgi:hypothetical protein